MSLEVKLDTSGMQRLLIEEPQKVDAWLRGVAITMVSDIKLKFGTGPAGITYKRGSRYHVASSPGSPPNSDTGTLINSIRHEPAGYLTYHIATSVEYAEYVENGNTRGMAARPYMAPVFNDWSGKIEADARENLNLEP